MYVCSVFIFLITAFILPLLGTHSERLSQNQKQAGVIHNKVLGIGDGAALVFVLRTGAFLRWPELNIRASPRITTTYSVIKVPQNSISIVT